MYKRITIPTKSDPIVAAIAKRLGYRKLKADILITEAVTLTDLNWSGGTRSEYTAVDLTTGAISQPDLGKPAPWENRAEGQRVTIPDGVAIVRTGVFCGTVSVMTVYINPANTARLIGASA